MGPLVARVRAKHHHPNRFDACFQNSLDTMPDTPDAALLQSSPCLQGERVAFTGTLASMTHRQASELVEQNGGEAASHISRQTTMLVVGEEGWPLEADGKASLKLQQAVESVRQGATLHILTEFEWLHLLGLEQRERDEHRLFTPAMLQQKLGISVGVVRRWERLGLIRAVQRVFRLPYFDFQEVAGVRRLQEMLNAGIPREQILAQQQEEEARSQRGAGGEGSTSIQG